MKNENPASLVYERAQLLLEIARMRRAGLRVWLVASAAGWRVLKEDAPDEAHGSR